MNRRDAHLDAMLRHLGAAYYESLHGRATQSDVDRAVGSVAGHFGEEPPKRPAGHESARAAHHGPGRQRHHGRWHSRVRDVMTTSLVTVDRITPCGRGRQGRPGRRQRGRGRLARRQPART
jgi:hypothetical protein